MRNNRAIDVLSGLVTLGSLAVLLAATGELSSPADTSLPRQTGQALARQAIALLAPGGKVSLIARDTVSFPQPASAALVDSFRKELSRSGVVLNEPRWIQVDPLRPLEAPPGDYVELMRRAANGDVLVSFMGPPMLTPEQKAQVVPALGKVKVLAFCPGSSPGREFVDGLLRDGFIKVAVLDRPVADSAAAQVSLKSFGQTYEVIRGGASRNGGDAAGGKP